MAGVFDILASALSGASQPPDNTPVSGVDAVAPRPQVGTPGAGTAYDNSPELQAVKGVQGQYAPHQGMFHTQGTLRNLLGTLGDAFLVQSGHQPVYAPQVQREKIADAMVGFQNNPGIAASRIAGTAAPGSDDLALKMYDASQQQELRKQVQEQNNQYKTALTADRKEKQDNVTNQYVNGILTAAARTGDPAKWAAARTAAQTYAGNRGIDDIGQDFGIPDKLDDYVTGTGTTANQVQRIQTSEDSIKERNTANLRNNATSRANNANTFNKPTDAAILQDLMTKQKNGEPLSSAEDAYLTLKTTRPTKSRLAIPGLSVAPPGGGTNRPVPTAADRDYVKKNPNAAAAFKAHFGINP